MNYNHYSFLLDNYRKKMDHNWDLLSVRKAISESISNESLRVRQQYRHEMAKKRREELENARIMNRKMREIKEKEKEIARRYRMRNNYGQLHGPHTYMYGKTKLKSKDLTVSNESTITVLLPFIKKKENPAEIEATNASLEYEVHTIPKKLLPSGKEDINAYKVVKKTHELCQKNGENRLGNDGVDVDQRDGGSGGMTETLDQRTLKSLQKNTNRLEYFNSNASKKQLPRKTKNSLDLQTNHMQNYKTGHLNYGYSYHHGPSYEEILNYYRHGGGLYRDDGGLSVFGKSRNANKYELLIVDDGPRTEEIRVKQKTRRNPRAYDILTIKENHPNTPRD